MGIIAMYACTFVCTYVCTCTTCVTFYTYMYIRVVISTNISKQWSNQLKYQVRLTILVYMVQFSHNITDACILHSCSGKSICKYAMVYVSKCMYVHTRENGNLLVVHMQQSSMATQGFSVGDIDTMYYNSTQICT